MFSFAQNQTQSTMWQRATLGALAVALMGTSLASSSEGGAGQKVATALEEMALIIVLLLAHLLVSKFWGEGGSNKKQKAKAAPEDPETESDDAAAPDARDGEPPAQREEEEEEFQSREIGRLTTKIRATVQTGTMVEAESLMRDLQEIGGKPGNLRRACWAVAYGEIVGGFVRCGDAAKAAAWLDAFAAGAPLIRPSTACANSVIAALGAKGMMTEAEAWLARMPQIGIRVDEETFSAVIGACTRAGDADRAIHWLKEMRKNNMKPSFELHKLVLQSSDGGEATSPTDQASPTAELTWRQQPTTPPAPEERAKDADTDTNWRAAPRAPAAEPQSAVATPAAATVQEPEKSLGGSGRQPLTLDGVQWKPRSTGNSLQGIWSAEWGETYEVWAHGADWHCTRWSPGGRSTSFAIVRDQADGAYWWGDDWKCFLEERADQLLWHDAEGWQRHPAVVWWKS